MQLKQLRNFVRIAESRSLSQASDQLRLAQPSLSRQMKMLENEIGQPLFIRHARGMELTDCGQELLMQVSGLVRQLEKVVDNVRSSVGNLTGQVAIGFNPTICSVLADRLAERVAERLPGIVLRIVEGYGGHLIEWLHRGELDVAFIYGPASDLHLQTKDLFYEDLHLVSPRHWQAPSNESISMADAAKLKLALPSQSHSLRSLVEAAAKKAKAPLNLCFEGDSFRVLKAVAVRSLFHTILPRSAIREEELGGLVKVTPITNPRITRQIIVATPPGRSETRVTQAVRNLAIEELAAMIRAQELDVTPADGIRSMLAHLAPDTKKKKPGRKAAPAR
jgi:DNA-binding transcriptional LysR family regulator